MHADPGPEKPSRRDVLRRGAILGGGLVWSTPIVQSTGIAFAQQSGSPPPDQTCRSTGWTSSTNNVAVTGGSDMRIGRVESNDVLALLYEQVDVTAAADVPVDASVAGTYRRTANTGSPGVVPAGTVLTSVLLHFDPFSRPQTNVNLVATITFDQPILGLIFKSGHLGDPNTLGATDAFPGLSPAVRYSGSALRGGFENGDTITWSGANTVTVNLRARSLNMDEVRVILAGCPR